MSENKKKFQYVALAMLGQFHPHLTNELFKFISHSGCIVVENKISLLGTEWSANFLLAGTWNAIAKLETGLAHFEHKHDVKSVIRRTEAYALQDELLPYVVYITSIEKNDAIAKVAQFFTEHGLAIRELSSVVSFVPLTKIQLLTITLVVMVPASRLLANVRENLMLFCDDHNFDAVMEIQKNF
jgi:glycine cleavage system transcriptional repressor